MIVAVALMMASLAVAEDRAAGERLFAKHCAACHTLRAGEPHRIGPNLAGISDRRAGTVAGYARTSTAMTAAGAQGMSWDDATLSAYLAAPRAVVPGTIMTFVGLARAEDRAALVAYLRRESGPEKAAPR